MKRVVTECPNCHDEMVERWEGMTEWLLSCDGQSIPIKFCPFCGVELKA